MNGSLWSISKNSGPPAPPKQPGQMDENGSRCFTRALISISASLRPGRRPIWTYSPERADQSPTDPGNQPTILPAAKSIGHLGHEFVLTQAPIGQSSFLQRVYYFGVAISDAVEGMRQLKVPLMPERLMIVPKRATKRSAGVGCAKVAPKLSGSPYRAERGRWPHSSALSRQSSRDHARDVSYKARARRVEQSPP